MRVGLCSKKYRVRVIIPFVLICSLILFYYVLKRLEPAFVEISRSYGEEQVVDIINITAADIFSKYNVINAQQSKNEIIITDTSMLNALKSDFTTELQEKLRDTKNTIKIPLGSMSGFYLLNGVGPPVTVKILPISQVRTDFEDKFEGQGINYVKHSIYMNVRVKIMYRGFLLHSSSNVETSIPVIENINSGTVPQYYGAMDVLQ